MFKSRGGLIRSFWFYGCVIVCHVSKEHKLKQHTTCFRWVIYLVNTTEIQVISSVSVCVFVLFVKLSQKNRKEKFEYWGKFSTVTVCSSSVTWMSSSSSCLRRRIFSSSCCSSGVRSSGTAERREKKEGLGWWCPEKETFVPFYPLRRIPKSITMQK